MTQSELTEDDRNQHFVRHLNAAHRPLLAYLISLLGNRHDAEDVLQRASVTMWQRFDTFQIGTDFLAWASTVAFYESRNFQRVANRSRLHFNESLLKTLADERLIDLAQHERRLDALDRCLESLDEPRQQLVKAAYLGEGSMAMLAKQLGRAPQTLYNKLTIIRRLLAECVQRRLLEGAER
jgi:RNA polymerase sigma-70 factor (ECF subfamily)